MPLCIQAMDRRTAVIAAIMMGVNSLLMAWTVNNKRRTKRNGCIDLMERGTVEWNGGTVEWNGGMVERWTSGMGNYE